MWLPGTFLNQSSDTKIKVKIGQNLKIKSTVKGLTSSSSYLPCISLTSSLHLPPHSSRGIVRQNSMWDYLVFRRVQQSLGGRVRLVVTGSAPISEKVLTFLRCSLGCLVSTQYALYNTHHTLNPTHCIPHTTPHTLHPKHATPHTLHPTHCIPHTLHPSHTASHTLHPTHCIPHTASHTLHPTHCIPHTTSHTHYTPNMLHSTHYTPNMLHSTHATVDKSINCLLKCLLKTSKSFSISYYNN